MSWHDFYAALAKRLHVPSIDWQKDYLEAVKKEPPRTNLSNGRPKITKSGRSPRSIPVSLRPRAYAQKLVPDVPYDVIIDIFGRPCHQTRVEIYQIAAERAHA